MKLKIEEILKATGGKLALTGSVSEISTVSIDTRTIVRGDLFVAIRGQHFNGHDFINDAVKNGAAGVVFEKGCYKPKNILAIEVEDSIRALGDIASLWRSKLSLVVIAVTGSNGKSTTKEMIAAALKDNRKVVRTEGNFNNLIGLPLQVMRASNEFDVALFEMGMNAAREIARLTEIAKPDIGLITNVNPAHLEKLHTVENVAKAKGELFETMKKDGTVIVNAEDPWCVKLGQQYPGRKITFGMQNDCDVQFGRMVSEGLDDADLRFYAKGREFAIHLPVPGVHNAMNAMAAVAVGMALGISIPMMLTGLEHFTAMKMRMERVQLLNGVQLVNDCYNANPSSMQVAIRMVGAAKKAGRFIAVLGDMLELGDVSKEKHYELGKFSSEGKVSKLFITGEYANETARGAFAGGMKKTDVKVFKTNDELKKALLEEIKTGDVVLIKGSRGMKMEVVSEFLKNTIGV